MARSDDVRALGRYTLEQSIATGTTATIWRALDTKTGTQVAVKRFHAHLFADRLARRRMDNEAKAARRVHAPTIVSAIDVISTRDEFALVFPLVPGTPLSERILDEPRLTAEETAVIVADVADALAAIHLARMVHRDVKPGNILVGDDGRAHLLDFGISRTVTDGVEAAAAMTGAGLAIGTLPYMAPEQLTAQPISGAADVFALGVVFYELLSGKRPFSAVTPVALVVEQRVAPARIDGAPEPLVDVALHAMKIDPLARPTAAEVSAAMSAWLAQPLASDAPTAVVATASPVVRTTPTNRWRGAAVGVGALAALVLVAVVALAAMQPAVTSIVPPTDQPLAAAIAPQTSASPEPSTSVAPSPVPPTQSPQKPAQTQSTPQPPTPKAPPPPAGGHRQNHHHHHHNHHHHHGHHRH